MRQNLDATGGLVMAEALTTALTAELGRDRAGELVGAASRRALEDGRALAATAAEVPEIGAALDHDEILAALDPAAYLGQADQLIDRALTAHHERVGAV